MKSQTFIGVAVVLVGGCLSMLALAGCGKSGASSDGPQAPATVQAGDSASSLECSEKYNAAFRQAAESGRYLFVLFFKAEDDQTLAMRKVFDNAMKKLDGRAQSIALNITDESEKGTVEKFGLGRAPMPLVLAFASNGAITGGFPTKVEEQQLLDAFATPGTERVMKSLQDGKLVFVCVQNGKTKSNDAAMQGVRDFKADVRFASATEIVTLDPADEKETGFLKDLKVSPDISEATTVFVAPTGAAIGTFEGATNKNALVEVLGKANTSCGPGGCGPGGCGPKK